VREKAEMSDDFLRRKFFWFLVFAYPSIVKHLPQLKMEENNLLHQNLFGISPSRFWVKTKHTKNT